MASSRDREGYILIDRNMCEWRWWQKHNTVIVFLWLLMKAQFHESYFKGVKVSRGQVATSVANIEKSNGLSRQEVRTAISNLKSTNAITTERYHNFIVITIVNYDEYQNLTIKKTKKQLSSNHLATILQPHTNTYNTDNEEERSKGSLRSDLPKTEDEIDFDKDLGGLPNIEDLPEEADGTKRDIPPRVRGLFTDYGAFRRYIIRCHTK